MVNTANKTAGIITKFVPYLLFFITVWHNSFSLWGKWVVLQPVLPKRFHHQRLRQLFTINEYIKTNKHIALLLKRHGVGK
jgi:hypothetical protein